MSEQVMSSAMATQVENAFINRIEDEIDAEPAVKDVLTDTLLELLMSLFSGGLCGGDDVTPEQAIERTKKLSKGERAVLRSRLTKRISDKGVKNARKLAVETADATEKVARASTTEERVAFAQYVQALTSESYQWI